MPKTLVRVLFLTSLLAPSGTGSNAQDAAAGEKVFAACKACHQVGESAKNGVGPELNGLFERAGFPFRRFSVSMDSMSVAPIDGAAAWAIRLGSASLPMRAA